VQKKNTAAATGAILSPPSKRNGNCALNGVPANVTMHNPAVAETIKTGGETIAKYRARIHAASYGLKDQGSKDPKRKGASPCVSFMEEGCLCSVA
jgi:hypothetical protein